MLSEDVEWKLFFTSQIHAWMLLKILTVKWWWIKETIDVYVCDFLLGVELSGRKLSILIYTSKIVLFCQLPE